MDDVCPTCDGTGEVHRPYYLDDDETHHRYHPCPDCDPEPDRARLEARLREGDGCSDGRAA